MISIQSNLFDTTKKWGFLFQQIYFGYLLLDFLHRLSAAAAMLTSHAIWQRVLRLSKMKQ